VLMTRRWVTTILTLGLLLGAPVGYTPAAAEGIQAASSADPEKAEVYDELMEELARISGEIVKTGVNQSTDKPIRRVLDVAAVLSAEISRRHLDSISPGTPPGRYNLLSARMDRASEVLRLAHMLLSDVYRQQGRLDAAYWLLQPHHYRRRQPAAQEVWERAVRDLDAKDLEPKDLREARLAIVSLADKIDGLLSMPIFDGPEVKRLLRQKYNMMCDLSEAYLKAGKREAAFYLVREVGGDDLVLISSRKKELISRIGPLDRPD
jgi:hypothetical protein